MRKLAPLFAFLLAAAPAVALAQDRSFDRINLKLRDKDKTVDVTVEKDGKAVFVFPDRTVTTKLSADQLAHLEGSVKGVFTRGSPATDLGAPKDRPTFELVMEGSNGIRWTAKGPIEVLRGGPLPAVYHVVRDIEDVEKKLPAPEERLALPAPEERLALPAPPERLMLPAPAPKAPTSIVLTEGGRRVEVLPASGELVVTTSDGTTVRVPDAAAVDAIVKAATDARLAEHANRFRVKASGSADPFKLVVTGESGSMELEGPLDVASWSSPELRASVGPIVAALGSVSSRAESDLVAARKAAEEKTKSKPGLLGINSFIESFKAGAADFQNWGRNAYGFVKNTAIPRATAFLGGIADYVKGAWDRFRGRGEAKPAEIKSEDRTDIRGFSRTTGMADALDLRVRAEADRAEGKGVDKR